MCKLFLERGCVSDVTTISNVFIDEYMPNANGEFVKIYLHLLRLLNSSSTPSYELSTETIADYFNLLDSDVMRALKFWADQELLSLSFDQDKQLNGIVMKPILSKNTASLCENDMLAKASGESSQTPIPECCGVVVPSKKTYTASQIARYAKDQRVKHLTFLAQTYLGTTLSSRDINCILYMLEELNLEVEFIEYLIESCISSGCKSLSRIEKKAVEYVRKNVSTIEGIKNYENVHSTIYKNIYKIFALTPKTPIKKELSYIVKWSDTFGFSDEIILEACNRTMEHTHTGSFQYADTILTNWHKHNIHSLEEIKKLDDAHSSEMKQTFHKEGKKSSAKKIKSFEQRTYDYDQLEQKLLFHQNKKFQEKKLQDE